MSFYHQETELFSFFPRLFGIDKISKLLLRYFTCRDTVKKLVLLVIYSMAKLEMPVIYSETRKFFSFHPDF